MSDKEKMEKNRPKVQTNVRQTVVASARITKSQPAPQTNTASTRSTSSKTQTIAVSKMTKLILKPSPLPKNPSAGKVTIKKYITKPVTANKSRSTLVSHQTTFRVQNILKTATNQQHTAQASNVDAIDSDNVIQIESTENERQPSQQPLAVEHNESGKNLLNSNTFEIPILQEITSTINNCLAVTNRSESDLGNSKSPRKSSKEPNENIQKCQLKSYDPIEARQFIRTQKEKRKEAAQDKSNAPLSKEEIKRRLSALHKNTLQIVSKNVKRARENSTDRGSTTKTAHVEKKIRPDTPRKEAPKFTQSTPSNQPIPMDQPHTINLFQPVTPSKFIPSIKSGKNRIGILRRTEEFSSPIGLSPFPLQSTLIEPNSNKHLEKSFPSPLITPNIDFGTKSKAEIRGTDSFEFIRRKPIDRQQPDDMQLKAPESAVLKSSIFRENETQTSLTQHTPEQKLQKSNNDITFWLRPSPVQVYPYNFIMAVRKKLEAITNPVLVPKAKQQKPMESDLNSFKSPISRPKSFFNSQFRVNLEQNPNESDQSVADPQQHHSPPATNKSDLALNKAESMRISNLLVHSSEPEDYSMHFSPAQSSHKLNKEKLDDPYKARDRDSQDTLSISSSILSQSSPEKRRKGKKNRSQREAKTEPEQRQMSPLNTEHVNGLHIHSRNTSKSATANEMTKADSQQISSTQSSSKQDSNNVQKLLHEFNESLSMVIKVNKHLRRVLTNPSSQANLTKSQPPSKPTTKYSDDFEQSSETIKPSAIGEELPSVTSNKQDTSYKSFTVLRTESNQSQQGAASSSKSNIVESIAELSNHINTQISLKTSISNQTDATITNNLEIITQQTKTSSTQIQEDLSQYSESPTNDLKSISLSIAKKSDATDTEQHSNVLESIQKHIVGEGDTLNQSIGSDIFAIFNKTAVMDATTWSEHNVSYASLGMCDRLLQSEKRKTEDLTSLLKIREKAIIDRFKGQIAWLELRKQKHKEKGLTAEISGIKKKQRALLMKLNQDREEIHGVLKEKQQIAHQKNVNYNISNVDTRVSIRRSSIGTFDDNLSTQGALKAIELNGGGSALENMLQRREDELQRRRQHVEKLLNWHRRLDVEERAIIKMEEMVMLISSTDAYQTTSHEQINDTLAITVQHHRKRTNCHSAEHSMHEQSLTNVRATTKTTTLNQTHFVDKKHRQIQKIEDSLNTLKMISARSLSSDGSQLHLADDSVEIYGRQLNKLWKRLTGARDAKFLPDEVYQLSKNDLEQVYEDAKVVVLQQFHDDGFKRRLIDNSISIIDEAGTIAEPISQHTENNLSNAQEQQEKIDLIVPSLNLDSSADDAKNDVASDTDQGYYFERSKLDEVSDGKATQIELPNVPLDRSEPNSIEDNTEQFETDLNADDQSAEIINSREISTQNENESTIKSDITEDSLNKITTNETEIQTDEKLSDEIATEIPSTAESTPPKEQPKFRIFMQNTTPMIEDTSFPHIEGQSIFLTTIDSDMSVLSTNSVSPMKRTDTDENRYQSDDFEEAKSTDIQTSIETITKATTQDSEEKSEIITGKSSAPNELEQRLIVIGDGMKELSETISHSPVLSCDSNHSGSEKNDSDRIDESDKPATEESNEISSIPKTIGSEIIETVTENGDLEGGSGIERCGNGNGELNQTESEESSYTNSIVAELLAENGNSFLVNDAALLNKRQYQYSMSSSSIDYNKVPEADALKRPQTPPEPEATSTDQSSAIFPLLREIPNKPPPPYPAHRQLPKVPTLPSDTKIKEIVFERIETLFSKPKELPNTPVINIDDETFIKSPTPSFDTSTASPTVANDEQNIFERIILDCCDEFMHDINTNSVTNSIIFKHPLAFYNPPNRLKCLQEHGLKRIYKLLNQPMNSDSTNAIEGRQSSFRSCLPAHVEQLTFNNRRKREAVDEILFHEMYEEEVHWTNFDAEEEEIRNSVTDLNTLLSTDTSDAQDDVSANLTATE